MRNERHKTKATNGAATVAAETTINRQQKATNNKKEAELRLQHHQRTTRNNNQASLIEDAEKFMKRLDEFKARKGAEKEPQDSDTDEMHAGGAEGAGRAGQAMASGGGVAGAGGRGEPKVRVGYYEPLSLWVQITCCPGINKSKCYSTDLLNGKGHSPVW